MASEPQAPFVRQVTGQGWKDVRLSNYQGARPLSDAKYQSRGLRLVRRRDGGTSWLTKKYET